MIFFEKEGATQGSDQNIGLTGQGGQVYGAGVGQRDGAVGSGGLAGQQQGERSSDDLAPAHDDGVLPGGGNFPEAQDFQNASGGAGKESGRIAEQEFSKIERVEAVDVLGGGDPCVNNVVGEGGGKRGLNQDAVDLGIGVESIDFLEEGGKRRGFRENEGPAGDTHLLGALFLPRDVSPGGGILADADEDEPRADAACLELFDAAGGFPVGTGRKSFPIEDPCRHGFRMP